MTYVSRYIVSMDDGKRPVNRRPAPPKQVAQDIRRLKGQRLIAGLSLSAAAERAGISQGHLSKLERGLKSAGPDALHALAGAYGCRVAKLLPYQPDEDEPSEEVPEAA